jgi:ClpP class serine protease
LLTPVPCAKVGSIGVIREGLNYNEILEKHGVKPLILKAGEMKNPISSFGKVSKQEIEEETKRMEHVHEQFIELCQKNRPTLETGICDGTILTANAALSFGLVDRILTSDEYILERIAQGDLVMHLHRTQGSDPSRLLFARALDVLPHLATKWKSIDKDKVLGHVVRGLVFGSMLHNKFF